MLPLVALHQTLNIRWDDDLGRIDEHESKKKIAKQKELTANSPQQMLFAEELTTLKPFYSSNSTRQALEHKFRNYIPEELKLGSVILIRRKQK